MARPRAKLDVLNQAPLVAERLESEPAGSARERLLAVSHGLEGEMSLQEIADALGRSRATVQTWLDLYREGGVERLCGRSPTKVGRKHGLGAKAGKELRKKLAKGSFRRAEDVRAWLERRFGIERSTSTVRRWMGKLGVVFPRKNGQ